MKPLVRRTIAITTYIILFFILTVGFPVLAPLAAITDIVRCSKFVGIRLLCFGWTFLGSELLGLLRAAYIRWRYASHGAQRYAEANYALQRWWSGVLFSAVCRLFSLRLEVEGAEQLARGPYVLLMRHTSIVDTLLPSHLAANAFAVRLRYVLKAELRADPALDIVTDRIPNYFVNRRARDTAAEVANIRALAAGMGAHDAAVIWPEGTRFTPDKWQYALRQLRERDGADRT
jgi:hypothetical protein